MWMDRGTSKDCRVIGVTLQSSSCTDINGKKKKAFDLDTSMSYAMGA